jgi:MFS family permease
MSLETPPPMRLRRATMSAITLLGGVSLAVIPAATVSIASRLFTPGEQGVIAVAVTVATFAGQLAFAVIVESRLSSAGTERRVVFPLWLAAASVVAGIAVLAAGPNVLVLCIGLPVLVAALEVGRGVSVAERLDRREIWASVLVGVGALAGVLAGFAEQPWALVPLVGGIVAATVVRCLPVEHRASRPEPRVMGWVVADTAITGAVYPLLSAMILAFLGPSEAVLFAAISTVSGLLAIPLNFMRLRLLKEHSTLDIVVSAGAVVAAIAALLVAEWLGVFGYLFGEAWSTSATLLPLLVACAWRAASLATTIPFAALRRRGAVRLVTGLRAAVSALTFALAALALLTGELAVVFAGLLVAELASAAVYEAARRRTERTAGAAQPADGRHVLDGRADG